MKGKRAEDQQRRAREHDPGVAAIVVLSVIPIANGARDRGSRLNSHRKRLNSHRKLQ
jgi:hypothetical protein